MHDSSLSPRAPSLASLFGFGTARVPDVAPADQTSAEQFVKAMQEVGVQPIHDTSAENHPQE